MNKTKNQRVGIIVAKNYKNWMNIYQQDNINIMHW